MFPLTRATHFGIPVFEPQPAVCVKAVAPFLHPAQTLLNVLRAPQAAVVSVQKALDGAQAYCALLVAQFINIGGGGQPGFSQILHFWRGTPPTLIKQARPT